MYDNLIMEELSRENEMLKEALKNSRWISITERLPDDVTHVLAWDGEQVRFVCGGSGLTFNAFAKKLGITHWMPQPMPPKKERGKE